MNNEINYKKVINLFNYFIKIIVKHNYKPRNLGTNQIPFLDKIVKQIPYGAKGYLEIKPCYKENTIKPRFELFFITNIHRISLNTSALKDDCMAASTLRQKLEFLDYIGLIDFLSTSRAISNPDYWDKKINFNWNKINQNHYNGLDLFFNALKNEGNRRKGLNKKLESMNFSFLLCCFIELLKESKSEIISLIQLTNERFFDNVFLRGTKKQRDKAMHLFLFVNDQKNNYPKIYKQFLTRYGKVHFIELMQRLVTSLDLENIYPQEELAQEINYYQEAKNILDDLNNFNLRKQQSSWKELAIGLRRMQGQTKDDVGEFYLNQTYKVEAAHIISVKEIKAKIVPLFERKEYKKIYELYQKLWSMQNVLILPVDIHRDLDHGEITIYKDGSIYNYLNQKLDIKLEYIPPKNFLPNKIAKNTI